MTRSAVRVVLNRLACVCLVLFFFAMYFSRHDEEARTIPVSSQVRSLTLHAQTLYVSCTLQTGQSRYTRVAMIQTLLGLIGTLPTGPSNSY